MAEEKDKDKSKEAPKEEKMEEKKEEKKETSKSGGDSKVTHEQKAAVKTAYDLFLLTRNKKGKGSTNDQIKAAALDLAKAAAAAKDWAMLEEGIAGAKNHGASADDVKPYVTALNLKPNALAGLLEKLKG